MNLFFENSTRTRTTFEAAAKRLSANVLNIDIARSSTSKGETLRDTLWNLEAMAADIFVVPKPFVHTLQLSMQVMAVMHIQHKPCWTC